MKRKRGFYRRSGVMAFLLLFAATAAVAGMVEGAANPFKMSRCVERVTHSTPRPS